MNRLKTIVGMADRALFQPPHEGRGVRMMRCVAIAALFVAGVLHWVGFMDGGNIALTAHDWPAQYVLLNVMKQAVTEQAVPYHISTAALGGGTTRFFSIPDVMFFPLLPLLPRMTYGQFMLAHLLLLYAAGFVGLLVIGRRYRLSLTAFTALFLLFNFNGHITAHLGVGHPWYGYFLLPFLALFLLELVEGRTGIAVPIKLALTLAAMQLEGCFHIMLYGLAVVVLLAIMNRRYRAAGALAVLFTALLGAFRFAPPAVEYARGGYSFVSGYRSLGDLFQALVTIKEYDSFHTGGIFGRQGWWEYDLFVGVIGLAVVVYLGIAARWQKSWDLGERAYAALDLPLFLLALFSLSYFYAFIAKLPVPLLNSERCSSRFIVLPFAVLLVIACIRMQGFLDWLGKSGRLRWLAVPALMEMGFELVNHSVRWSPMLLERTENRFPFNVDAHITVQADPTYKAAVVISAGISALTLIVLAGVLTWRSFRPGGRAD